MEYPWFSCELQIIDENIVDICSEDVSFYKKLNKLGFICQVDTKVLVGHEKMNILS
jgi:hypothetical protein